MGCTFYEKSSLLFFQSLEAEDYGFVLFGLWVSSSDSKIGLFHLQMADHVFGNLFLKAVFYFLFLV